MSNYLKEEMEIYKFLFEMILKALTGQSFPAIAGAILGAFGILNIIDSLIVVLQNKPWGLLDPIRPLLLLFREATRSVVGFLVELINLRIPGIWQDYVAMGLIVAGMRFRSTLVIRREILANKISEYKEDFLGRPLIVTGTSRSWSWVGFFAWRRLVFAFVLWPVKLFGASKRYLSGDLRNRGQGSDWDNVREQQYLTFFGSVVWAALFLGLLLIVEVGLLLLDVEEK